jgi:hypothetical protein
MGSPVRFSPSACQRLSDSGLVLTDAHAVYMAKPSRLLDSHPDIGGVPCVSANDSAFKAFPAEERGAFTCVEASV